MQNILSSLITLGLKGLQLIFFEEHNMFVIFAFLTGWKSKENLIAKSEQ